MRKKVTLFLIAIGFISIGAWYLFVKQGATDTEVDVIGQASIDTSTWKTHEPKDKLYKIKLPTDWEFDGYDTRTTSGGNIISNMDFDRATNDFSLFLSANIVDEELIEESMKLYEAYSNIKSGKRVEVGPTAFLNGKPILRRKLADIKIGSVSGSLTITDEATEADCTPQYTALAFAENRLAFQAILTDRTSACNDTGKLRAYQGTFIAILEGIQFSSSAE